MELDKHDAAPSTAWVTGATSFPKQAFHQIQQEVTRIDLEKALEYCRSSSSSSGSENEVDVAKGRKKAKGSLKDQQHGVSSDAAGLPMRSSGRLHSMPEISSSSGGSNSRTSSSEDEGGSGGRRHQRRKVEGSRKKRKRKDGQKKRKKRRHSPLSHKEFLRWGL